MQRTKEEILAEYIATDLIRVINSPSELRYHFGTPEDQRTFIQHQEDYYRKLNNLLDELVHNLENA